MKQSSRTHRNTHTTTDVGRMKRRKALQLVSGMLSLSLLIVALGIYTSTRTESLSITGYASGAILAFGSFLGVLGLCLEENRKQLLIAAIVFLSVGILTSFLCLIVDGVFILLNIDMRPMKAGRCQFYTSGNSYIYENYYATVPCQGLTESCSLKVRSGTCYCCDLYDCANGGYLNNYYEFVGVRSCEDILNLYILIWVLTLLNLLAFILAIMTTAVLGSIKDLKNPGSSLPLSYDSSIISSPTAPLLTDHNTHTTQQIYPKASLYVSPADSGAPVVDSQGGRLENQVNPEPNPPPFAPLYDLLPYKR
ncbi:transmembrane protein 255B isoform X1 [Astyanax mexicanus]|uniref:transmembrane protein 255B isoform X1 n=2 Tax=Astyanax mexicanus TaxID=7994 RepID=UPI0020CB60CA|nr:transmembrane protein 255B isoform X1 [Astyanax mexicanus]